MRWLWGAVDSMGAACADGLAISPDAPRVVAPRIDPEVPVFALARYAGARPAPSSR